MLPMIFKFLGGPIISKVVDTGVRYLERKQEISEAKHTARLEIEAKKFEKTAGFERKVNGVEVQTRFKDFVRPEGLNIERMPPTAG